MAAIARSARGSNDRLAGAELGYVEHMTQTPPVQPGPATPTPAEPSPVLPQPMQEVDPDAKPADEPPDK